MTDDYLNAQTTIPLFSAHTKMVAFRQNARSPIVIETNSSSYYIIIINKHCVVFGEHFVISTLFVSVVIGATNIMREADVIYFRVAYNRQYWLSEEIMGINSRKGYDEFLFD